MLHIGFGSEHMQAPEGLESKFIHTRAHGGQFIEFYYNEMDMLGYGPREHERIRALSAQYGLPVTYHISWHHDEDDLGRYGAAEGALRLAEMMRRGFEIGARFLILHLGAYPEGERRLPVLERIREIVLSAGSALEQNDAVLCLENNTCLYTPNAVGVSVFEWDTLFAGVRSPRIGMCLDTGHAHVNGCLMEMTRVCAPYIRYIHLHDNDGLHDSHRAPGIGTIDWAAFYPALAALPHEPWVMFECPLADGYDSAVAGIRAAEAQRA